jgi:hypothetical protein
MRKLFYSVLLLDSVLLLLCILASSAYSQSTTPQLEQGPKLQIWMLKDHQINRFGSAYIRVFKFQVKNVMVCKAVYVDHQREFQKESNSKDDAIALALSQAATSLGDVPCE